MRIITRFCCHLIVSLLIVARMPATCRAGEKEQVELLEKLATQYEGLNRAASEYAAALEEVKDRATADAAVERYESAARTFISTIETFVPTLKAATKQGMKRFSIAEYDERARNVMRRQPTITQEWMKQTQRYAAELGRVDNLQGLSNRFWDVFNVQNVRVGITVGKISAALGSPMPANISKFMSVKLALYENFGPSKVVDIGIVGGSAGDRAEVEQNVRKLIGINATVVSLDGDQGIVITAAPIENLSDIVAGIDPANIKDRDEARHRIIISTGVSSEATGDDTAHPMSLEGSLPVALAERLSLV